MAPVPWVASLIAGSGRASDVAVRRSAHHRRDRGTQRRGQVDVLAKAAAQGYAVVLVFIGVDDARISEQRVAMRVLQGGHDVPAEKLSARFPRTMENLARAIA